MSSRDAVPWGSKPGRHRVRPQCSRCRPGVGDGRKLKWSRSGLCLHPATCRQLWTVRWAHRVEIAAATLTVAAPATRSIKMKAAVRWPTTVGLLLPLLQLLCLPQGQSAQKAVRAHSAWRWMLPLPMLLLRLPPGCTA